MPCDGEEVQMGGGADGRARLGLAGRTGIFCGTAAPRAGAASWGPLRVVAAVTYR